MTASWARNRRFDGSYCEQLACDIFLYLFAVVIEGAKDCNVWRGSPMQSVIAGEVDCLGRVAVAIGLALALSSLATYMIFFDMSNTRKHVSPRLPL